MKKVVSYKSKSGKSTKKSGKKMTIDDSDDEEEIDYGESSE